MFEYKQGFFLILLLMKNGKKRNIYEEDQEVNDKELNKRLLRLAKEFNDFNEIVLNS